MNRAPYLSKAGEHDRAALPATLPPLSQSTTRMIPVMP
jgi:hypothetical protein